MRTRPARHRVAWAMALAGATCGLFLAAGAWGHIVYGRPSLLGLVSGATRVAHVRVVDPALRVEVGEGGAQRHVVVVEVREALKGGGQPGERLRFATHGHGVAAYAAGEEVLVFLVPLRRAPELAVLEGAGIEWVSFQEHDERHATQGASGARALAAARDYAAAARIADPKARLEELRRVTLGVLTSGDERLAAGAVQDIALTDELPVVSAADAPGLVAGVVASATAPTPVRVALLAELGRRGWIDPDPLWRDLLHDRDIEHRTQVVRAAGRHPSPTVRDALTTLLDGDDTVMAAEAARALGAPPFAEAVPALAAALDHESTRVRLAAVRGLEGIGTRSAGRALETASQESRHADVRRRAGAALAHLRGPAERAPGAPAPHSTRPHP